MAKLGNVKRIIVEDFQEEDQDAVSKLATILNTFMSEVVDAMENNIDFDNLDQQIIEMDVTVDSSGVPTGNNKFKSRVGSAKGMLVIYAQNKTNVGKTVSGSPFITYTPSGNSIYTISKISGLDAGEKHFIRILVIG